MKTAYGAYPENTEQIIRAEMNDIRGGGENRRRRR
jgi:hypothetical protein